MEHLLFLIWMLLYPLVGLLERYVSKVHLKEHYDDNIQGLAVMIRAVIWLGCYRT